MLIKLIPITIIISVVQIGPPRAIIGLDKALTLEPDLWKKVEITPDKLRELVQDMKITVVGLMITDTALQGFAMFDDNGKQIGVWFSLIEAKTSLRMKDDHTVIIFTPDMDTYLKHEGNDSGNHNRR